MFKEQLLKKALRLYAGEHVLQRVLSLGEDALQLDAEVKSLTIYFQELAGIKPVIAKLRPDDFVGILYEYLNVMSTTITEHGGIIEKFDGDSIIAFWGLDENQDHALKACECAMECSRKMNSLNAKLIAIGASEVEIQIGINSGEVVIGNIGTVERINYTVLGDNVNLAFKLQEANRTYGTQTLISQMTKEKINDGIFSTLIYSAFDVEGKDSPIKIYTIDAKNS